MKKCSLCKIRKIDNEFNIYKRKGIPFLNSRCKHCELISRRERMFKDPSINIKRKLLAREESKTLIGKYKTLIKSLNKKKIYNNFSLEDYSLLSDKKCEYCSKDRSSVCPRINKLGYIAGNLQSICVICKQAKGRCESDESFQALMIRKYGTTPEKDVQLKSLIGKKSNYLTVVSIGDKARGHFYLNCKCDCGAQTIVREKQFLSQCKKSCGCKSRGKHDHFSLAIKYKTLLCSSEKLFNNLKSTARNRNILNTLTYEEYLPFYNLNCFYCNGINSTHGLDRIDNTKGYELHNIVSCCKICNTMKSTMTYDEFINHIKNILSNI